MSKIFLASSAIDTLGLSLIIIMGVVALLIVIALIWSAITRIVVMATYLKYNKIANSEDLTAREAAEKFLSVCDIENVEVKKCGFWRSILFIGGRGFGFGNSYSIYKKSVYLRKNIIDKNSVTAAAIATQKVGLAYQDKIGDKKFTFVARLKPILLFSPYALIPLSLLGLALDVFVFKTGGLAWTIAFSLIGSILFLLSLILTFYTITVEKRANDQALAMMEENDFLTEEERVQVKKIYNAYLKGYIADFVINLLYLILKILQLVAKAALIAQKNKK